VRAVGVQPEDDGNDDFKGIHIGMQTVFKPHVAAYLIVVQHVRLADGFDGGVHCRNACMEQPGDFGGGHPHLVTGYADRLVLYDNDSSFHGFLSFLNVASCKFLNRVQFFGKVLHVLVELLLGYLRIDLGGLNALVPQHGTHRFNGHAVGEEHRRGCRVTALVPRDMLRDAATFGNGTYFVQTGHVVGNGKYPSVLTQSPVLVDNPFGDVKQTDIGNHARFLTDPLVVIEIGADIVFR